MKRVPPSLVFEKEFNEAVLTPEGLTRMAGLGARFMLQKALENEVTEFLGREHYKNDPQNTRGYRNGYEPFTIAMSEGPMTLKVPQLRDTEEKFVSKLAAIIKNRSEALERIIPRLYVKGMSVRDIEDVLREDLKNPKTSRSVVSKLSRILKAEYDAWRNRDLGGAGILYLFIDGMYLPLRQGTDEKEAVLCAYGITHAGTKKLLHVTNGSRESYDAVKSFLQDMIQRGLEEPLLVISDDAPGPKKAVMECFPNSLRQLCQVHKMRNILSKLPRDVQKEMKKLIERVFRAKDYDTGLKMGEDLIRKFGDRYPSAMECLKKALPNVLTYLKFPKAHHKKIRTTNLLERLFGEAKRRSKVIPRFPTESSSMTLMYATLIDSSRQWRGVRMTVSTFQELGALWEKTMPEAARQRLKFGGNVMQTRDLQPVNA